MGVREVCQSDDRVDKPQNGLWDSKWGIEDASQLAATVLELSHSVKYPLSSSWFMASDCNRSYNFISECRRFESARGEYPPRETILFAFLPFRPPPSPSFPYRAHGFLTSISETSF